MKTLRVGISGEREQFTGAMEGRRIRLTFDDGSRLLLNLKEIDIPTSGTKRRKALRQERCHFGLDAEAPHSELSPDNPNWSVSLDRNEILGKNPETCQLCIAGRHREAQSKWESKKPVNPGRVLDAMGRLLAKMEPEKFHEWLEQMG